MTKQYLITSAHSAAALGSGSLQVLGTPALIAFLENTAMEAVQANLAEGQTTVGAYISVEHLRPTAIGDTLTVTAELTEQTDRKLTFSLQAMDTHGEVAKGTHVRYIVDSKRFMQKVEAL